MSTRSRVLCLLAALCLLPAARAGDAPAGKLKAKVKEVAGSAEYLKGVPKHFATLEKADPARRTVTLHVEGERRAREWPLAPDAEVKVMGWWGRLEHLTPGDRVWVWLRTDRKKRPVAVSMLADEASEQDIHGPGVKVAEPWDGPRLVVRPVKGERRVLDSTGVTIKSPGGRPRAGDQVYVQSAGGKARLILSRSGFEAARQAQKERLREVWLKDGLPGTVAFVHVFSGEADVMLDHEAMRWGRALQTGDAVTLAEDPPIKAVVKWARPWRERTQVRLVAHSSDLADLAPSRRVGLRRPAPAPEVDTALLPPDLGRAKGKGERVEWFLASIYCTCGVAGDICTGHFYTLASCNPNGCGMPNAMRRTLGRKIDAGLSDRQIFEELLKQHGPDLLRQHLRP
jgi:hypothetical protein